MSRIGPEREDYIDARVLLRELKSQDERNKELGARRDDELRRQNAMISRLEASAEASQRDLDSIRGATRFLKWAIPLFAGVVILSAKGVYDSSIRAEERQAVLDRRVTKLEAAVESLAQVRVEVQALGSSVHAWREADAKQTEMLIEHVDNLAKRRRR